MMSIHQLHKNQMDAGVLIKGIAASLLTPGRTVIDAVASLWFCKKDKRCGNTEVLTSSRISGIDDELGKFYEKYCKGRRVQLCW